VADLINEDFEGTGTPTGWFRGGSANFDYSTSPLVGSQSLRLAAATADYAVVQSLNQAEFWWKFRIKIETMPSGTLTILQGSDASFNNNYQVLLNSSGTLTIQDNSGFLFTTTTDTMAAGTIYDVWGHYKVGTGTNSICEVSFDVANAARPNSGNKYASGTNGHGTGNIAEYKLISSTLGAILVFDTVRITTTDVFGGGTLFTQTFTATLSPVAALVRQVRKTLAAALSFAGALTKTLRDAGFAATLSFVGALRKTIRDSGFAAALNFVGGFSVSKSFLKAFSATLSFAGTLTTTAVHLFTKALTATLSFTGNLVPLKLLVRAFAATLTFSGTIWRKTGKVFSATIPLSGTLRKAIRKRLAAALSFVASLFRGGATTVLAGQVTGGAPSIATAGSTATIVETGSAPTLIRTSSSVTIVVTDSQLRIEKTK
jgi:hypothetical protein